MLGPHLKGLHTSDFSWVIELLLTPLARQRNLPIILALCPPSPNLARSGIKILMVCFKHVINNFRWVWGHTSYTMPGCLSHLGWGGRKPTKYFLYRASTSLSSLLYCKEEKQWLWLWLRWRRRKVMSFCLFCKSRGVMHQQATLLLSMHVAKKITQFLSEANHTRYCSLQNSSSLAAATSSCFHNQFTIVCSQALHTINL